MDSLTSKLKALGVQVGTQHIPQPVKPDSLSIEAIIPQGFYRQTMHGEIFCIDHLYAPDYIHGQVPLQLTAPLDMLAAWSGQLEAASLAPSDFAFLDTETSGLAGGTGTFAFLVGVARFLENGFTLTQFFMRSPADEPALLTALTEYLASCKAIVTFNGKSFDAPILNTRYTLQGFTSPLPGLYHFDLLSLARKLWRDRLPSRALGFLEPNILGIGRSDDEIPGYLVPEYYLDYLHTGDATLMKGVLYHNDLDITSLAALMCHTAALLADPFSPSTLPGLDLAALARLFEDLKQYETAIRLFEKSLAEGMPPDFYWKTVERFATLFKKQQNWPAAVDLWARAADHGDDYAFLELAKYYEHVAKDKPMAIHWTQAAIDRINATCTSPYMRNYLLEEPMKRMARLQKRGV
ncbi:MAG TPA: ribonuclease H-like domain-containing protein [Anaerolineaceae bacterium]|nr:ribonuclease H-like domain-containing protein [Anaerolineaceae bacterium]HPN50817.1 ribonuclease H-like domain-containing protein [Anaerolineaceae bacterium]